VVAETVEVDEFKRMLVTLGDEDIKLEAVLRDEADASKAGVDDEDASRDEVEDDELDELDGVGAASVTSIVIGGGLTLIIEYPVVVAVVALGVAVTTTVCVVSGPSMVWVM
jgi:hypothetical protein